MLRHYAEITDMKREYYGGNEVATGTAGINIQKRELELQEKIISLDIIPEGALKICLYDREDNNGVLSDPINVLPPVYFGEKVSIGPAIKAFRGAANSGRLIDMQEAGYKYINLHQEGLYIPMEDNGITYLEYLDLLMNNMNKGSEIVGNSK